MQIPWYRSVKISFVGGLKYCGYKTAVFIPLHSSYLFIDIVDTIQQLVENYTHALRSSDNMP